MCFPNGNVLFLPLFSLSKSWGCAEILAQSLQVSNTGELCRFNGKRTGIFPSGNENAKKSYITLSNVARSPIISKIVITACFELNACFKFLFIIKG